MLGPNSVLTNHGTIRVNPDSDGYGALALDCNTTTGATASLINNSLIELGPGGKLVPSRCSSTLFPTLTNTATGTIRAIANGSIDVAVANSNLVEITSGTLTVDSPSGAAGRRHVAGNWHSEHQLWRSGHCLRSDGAARQDRVGARNREWHVLRRH